MQQTERRRDAADRRAIPALRRLRPTPADGDAMARTLHERIAEIQANLVDPSADIGPLAGRLVHPLALIGEATAFG